MARQSDWQVYSRQAMREGKTLQEASREWRNANRRVFRNPSSPESRYHHHRRRTVGELLRRGVDFGEARRLVDKGFDGYQHATKRIERGIVHAGERRNPSGETNWLLIGGIALAVVFLSRSSTSAANPLTTQGPWPASNLPPNQWGASAARTAPGPGGVFGAVGS